jgi:hypothetical protein
MNTATNDAMTMDARISRLEQTVRTMIALLKQETDAVRAIDVATFSQLQTTKSDLFDIYRVDIKALLNNKGDLKTLPDTVKDRIRGWEQDLSIARVENMSVLERAGKSFTRLRDRIVFLAKDSVMRSSAKYGANGALQMNSRKAISTGVHDRA